MADQFQTEIPRARLVRKFRIHVGHCETCGRRAATRLEPDYQLILAEVRASEQIAADETGWHVGGHPAWLHAWVGDRATAYAID